MVLPFALRFVVRNLDYAFTDAGYLVTCYSNHPCHLWLRWTNILPQKHIHERMVRGAPVGTYIDQCFVVFTDVEQNEPLDTFTHTFTVEPWPSCERRWFYFWGTVGGELSPSASAIFSKHRPFREIIYSDPGTGLVTVDGVVGRISYVNTWKQLHTGPGNYVEAIAAQLVAQIQSALESPLWLLIYRPVMTFNLANIPKENTIVAAEFRIYVFEKQDTQGHGPAWAIYQAWPAQNNSLQPSDYNNVDSASLTNEIPHRSLSLNQFNTFTFTEAGLLALPKGGIARLGIREATYDARGAEPAWTRGTIMRLQGWSVDTPYPWLKPSLVIYHSPKGV